MICDRCAADIESVKVIEPDLRDYASWLRLSRQYLRLSQTALANLAGVSRNTVGRIETEVGMPSKETMAALQTAIDERMNS